MTSILLEVMLYENETKRGIRLKQQSWKEVLASKGFKAEKSMENMDLTLAKSRTGYICIDATRYLGIIIFAV